MRVYIFCYEKMLLNDRSLVKENLKDECEMPLVGAKAYDNIMANQDLKREAAIILTTTQDGLSPANSTQKTRRYYSNKQAKYVNDIKMAKYVKENDHVSAVVAINGKVSSMFYCIDKTNETNKVVYLHKIGHRIFSVWSLKEGDVGAKLNKLATKIVGEPCYGPTVFCQLESDGDDKWTHLDLKITVFKEMVKNIES